MNRYKLLFLTILSAVLMFSCKINKSEPEIPQKDPVFPECIDVMINPGESVSISFTAVSDWELSIPVSALNWFYLDDNGMKEFSIKGKEGNYTYKLYAENIENLFESHSCTVSLSMKGQSKKVAEVSLRTLERTIEIFSAVLEDNTNYVHNEKDQYEYEENESSSLQLSWPELLSNYTLPIKIRSNFNWSITSFPQWLEVSTTSSEGDVTEVLLTAVPELLPMDETTGAMSFIDINNGNTVTSIDVTIPGSKDFVRSYADNLVNFNILGEYSFSGLVRYSYDFSYSATLNNQLLVFEKINGILHYADDTWMKLSFNDTDNVTESVIVSRSLDVAVEENTGSEREAILLAVPSYLLCGDAYDEIVLNSDRTGIRDDFSSFVLTTIHQEGLDPTQNWGVITPVNNAFSMAVKGASLSRTSSDDKYYSSLSDYFHTDEIYTVNYNNWFSYESLLIKVHAEYDEVCYYLPDASDEDYDDHLYLELKNRSDASIFTIGVDYFENKYSEAVVLMKDAKAVAVLLCHMDSSFWPEVDYNDIHFLAYDFGYENDDSFLPHDVELEELTSGDLYDQFKDFDTHIWKLTYFDPDSDKNAMICVPPFPQNGIDIYPKNSWIKLEVGYYEEKTPYIHISMTEEDKESGNQGYVVLKAPKNNLFVLVCERAFMN